MEQQALKLRADATPFVPKFSAHKLNANAQDFKPSIYSSYYSNFDPYHSYSNTKACSQIKQEANEKPIKNEPPKTENTTNPVQTEQKIVVEKKEEVITTQIAETKIKPEQKPITEEPIKIIPVEEKLEEKTEGKPKTRKIISYTSEYLKGFRTTCHSRPFHMKEVNVPLLKWKPPENEDKQVVIIKEVRNILNKISKSNYKELSKQIVNGFQYTQIVLDELSKILFNKAVKEASYVEYYMELCDMLFKKFKSNSMNFRKMFVSRCQSVFEGKKDEDLEKFTDIDEEEKRVKHKIRLMGNIRLIGELFIRGALTEEIVLICVEKLTSNLSEENVENLCHLYKKIGKAIYVYTAYTSGQTSIKKRPKIKVKKLNKDAFDDYVDKLCDLKNKDEISSRIKFMIQDVIELRETEWAPVFDEFVVKENESNKIVFHAKIKTPEKNPSSDIKPNVEPDPKVEMRERRKSSLNETNILGTDLETFSKVKLNEKLRLKAHNYVDEYLQIKSYEEAKTALVELLKESNTMHIWVGYFIMYSNSKKQSETTEIFELLVKLVKDKALSQNDLTKGYICYQSISSLSQLLRCTN